MQIELFDGDPIEGAIKASGYVPNHGHDLMISKGVRDELLERRVPEVRFEEHERVVFDRSILSRVPLPDQQVIVSTSRVIPDMATVRRGPGFFRN